MSNPDPLYDPENVYPEDEDSHELYDDGGHVRPEVLADLIDKAKDEMEDKILEEANQNAYYDETKLKVKCECEKESIESQMDDNSDDATKNWQLENNGNLPPGVNQIDLDRGINYY